MGNPKFRNQKLLNRLLTPIKGGKSESSFMELVSQDKVVASQEIFSMTIDSKSKLPVQ